MSDDTDKSTSNLVDISTKRQQLQRGAKLQVLAGFFVHYECLRRALDDCIEYVDNARTEIPVNTLLELHVALVRVKGGVHDLANLLNGIAQSGGDAA